MPYMNDPTNNIVDRVRLVVGDIWSDMELLADADYEYFLSKYNSNENRAALDAARALLFKLARLSRERTGDIEVYGSEWFKNYKSALELMIKNPELSISLAMPYAGGISKSDMEQNDCNTDNVTREIYIGFTAGRKLYQENTPDVTFDAPFTF